MLYEVSHDGHTLHLFGGSRPTTTPWSSPAIEALAASCEEFWNEVPAMGSEVQALAVKYGVEDVLHEHMRGYLDEAKTTLLDVQKELQTYTGSFELPEPDEDLRATIQRIVDNEVKHVPMR